MTELCSFSYTAFTLSFIYLILFFLVVRYLLNLVRANSAKKQAQKAFLGILLAQTLLRVIYFALFPFNSDNSCEPTMKGDEGEDTSGAAWWIHLLSNIPAILFLMAFSVLVYTFARIYHKVLLAGVWFQERRFKALTVVLVLLNIVTLVATFGDWAYAASNPHSDLVSFVDMLMYCVLSVSAILAGFFLAYGTLLYYQVQNIMRASSENAGAAGPGMGYNNSQTSQSHSRGVYEHSVSNGVGASASKFGKTPGMHPPSLLLPSALESGGMSLPPDAGTGFTPVHKRRGNRAEGGEDAGEQQEGTYNPPSVAPGGINLSPGPRPNAPTGFGSPPTARETNYPISGFASPNLPIKAPSSHVGASGMSVVAHSYVSSDGGASYSPEAVLSIATASADLLTPVPQIGPDGMPLPHNPSSATGPQKHEPVALAPAGAARATANGYASSVSPEYSQLPNSSQARRAGRVLASPGGTTTMTVPTGTPTDQLVGSPNVPYEPHTPRRGTSSLSRPSTTTTTVTASRTVPLSSSPPEDDLDEEDSFDTSGGRDRVAQIRGLANSTTLPKGVGVGLYKEGAHAYTGTGREYPTIAPSASRKYVHREEDDVNTSFTGSASSHSVPLLQPPTAQPPNPMRKIAFIAAICTMCLIVRTILLIVISLTHADFNWLLTLLYFAFSEVLPLLAMLKVFNTPTPLVHVLGAGAGGGGF